MLEIKETDFILLDEFPLKWRWLDAKWNNLPDNALDAIKPFTENKARQLCQYALNFENQFGLEKTLFEQIEQINSSVETEDIKKWLLTCSADLNQTVIVSWDYRLAVLVNWKVFCEYWDDFCYPSSDDATIFPLSVEWMLFYSHDEYFMFGKTLKPHLFESIIAK